MLLTINLFPSKCFYPGRAPKCSDDGIKARQLLPLLSKLFCISKLRGHKYNSIAVQNSNSEHVRYRPSLLAVPNSTSPRASKVSTFAARLPRLDSPSSSSSPSGQIDRGRLLCYIEGTSGQLQRGKRAVKGERSHIYEYN